MTTCTKCGQDKELTAFYASSDLSQCISCSWAEQAGHSGQMPGYDADGNQVGIDPKPVHRLGVTFICECPAGAQLLTVGDRIMLVAPGHPVSYVTPMGLEPIPVHEGCSA